MFKETREPCAFCPSKARITGEHLWSAWAGGSLGRQLYRFTRRTINGKVNTWAHTELNPKARVVCHGCNTGWMSQLEKKTKAVAKEMVVNCTETTLRGPDIATLAAFGFLKTVVGDHMHSNTPPFFTFEERQSFRKTLSIPGGVQMWLASVPFQHGLFKSMHIDGFAGTPAPFQLNIFTYGLGHLVVQVAGCKWKADVLNQLGLPPRLTQDKVWDGCSISVWPSIRTPVLWPPKAVMSRPVLDEFIVRWTHLVFG